MRRCPAEPGAGRAGHRAREGAVAGQGRGTPGRFAELAPGRLFIEHSGRCSHARSIPVVRDGHTGAGDPATRDLGPTWFRSPASGHEAVFS